MQSIKAEPANQVTFVERDKAVMLQASGLAVKYGSLTIVDDASFAVAENHWLMIVGPNGAGKSTVINAISQGVDYTGEILYDGADLRRMKSAKLARNIGVLAQSHSVTYSFTVGEVVRLGRYSYAPGIFSSKSDADNDSVQHALDLTGMRELEHHSVLELSGGELQRTFLAQVFAQDPKLLILDEPTNHLDLVYQKQVFGLIADWVKQPGRAVISVVHDLSLARAYGTDIMLMDKGRIVALGHPDTVLGRDRLQQVYAMDVYAWMRQMLSQWEVQ
ncbi:MAG: ABC transporter ATP-binding protein [Actinomycetia bacterium]|nr:ABC transporter ATP-binding protein [Actinomycetes bacterium]